MSRLFLCALISVILGGIWSCGGHNDSSVSETPANNLNPSPAAIDYFFFDRILSGRALPQTDVNTKDVQWSNYRDAELKKDYQFFASDGKLDVKIKLLETGYRDGETFPDYFADIFHDDRAGACKAYSTGYQTVTGILYARIYDPQTKKFSDLANSLKAPFTLSLSSAAASEVIISFNDKNNVNTHKTNGNYVLELHNLQWDGRCVYDHQESVSGYNHYCSAQSQLEALPSKPDIYGRYYCIKLRLGVSWNKYTPDLY